MKYFAGSLLVITVGLLLGIPNACAFDSQLQELQATQKQIREHAEEYLKNNGGGQGLTVFKHQLRDWIESKLAALDEKGSPIYFLVRWQPPYRFTMMNISANPWPLCSRKDEPADEWRTLFPTEME